MLYTNNLLLDFFFSSGDKYVPVFGSKPVLLRHLYFSTWAIDIENDKPGKPDPQVLYSTTLAFFENGVGQISHIGTNFERGLGSIGIKFSRIEHQVSVEPDFNHKNTPNVQKWLPSQLAKHDGNLQGHVVVSISMGPLVLFTVVVGLVIGALASFSIVLRNSRPNYPLINHADPLYAPIA